VEGWRTSRPGVLLPSSASVADVRLAAVADAAPGSGSARSWEDQARNDERAAAAARPALCAFDLPAHLAAGDRCGGVVALRESVKRWACFPQQRPLMIVQGLAVTGGMTGSRRAGTILCVSRRWSMRFVTVTVSRFPAGSTSTAAVAPSVWPPRWTRPASGGVWFWPTLPRRARLTVCGSIRP